LTSSALDECDVVSMLDGSVSCCVMLLRSSYRTHVLEKLTDCYGSLEIDYTMLSMLPCAVPSQVYVREILAWRECFLEEHFPFAAITS